MMRLLRHAIAACVLTVVPALWLAGGVARGQSTGTGTGTPPATTPVASPTATVTPSLPSGQDLLARMVTAMAARNTYHVTTHSDEEIPLMARAISTSQEDVSTKPRLGHFVETTRTTRLDTWPARTTTRREESVIVKNSVATRIGTKPWSCTTISQITQVVGGVFGPPKIQSIDNLGPETVDFTPAWHVREVAVLTFEGQLEPITADYYISQADFTLVHVTGSDSLTFSGVTAHATIVQDVTNYGETVRVRLPAACKGTSTPAAALARALPGGFDSAAPAGVLGQMGLALTRSVVIPKSNTSLKGANQ